MNADIGWTKAKVAKMVIPLGLLTGSYWTPKWQDIRAEKIRTLRFINH